MQKPLTTTLVQRTEGWDTSNDIKQNGLRCLLQTVIPSQHQWCLHSTVYITTDEKNVSNVSVQSVKGNTIRHFKCQLWILTAFCANQDVKDSETQAISSYRYGIDVVPPKTVLFTTAVCKHSVTDRNIKLSNTEFQSSIDNGLSDYELGRKMCHISMQQEWN